MNFFSKVVVNDDGVMHFAPGHCPVGAALTGANYNLSAAIGSDVVSLVPVTSGAYDTKDAGTVDPAAGLVTIRGRLDSQVSVGGLKVDLTEVEQTMAALPEVAEVVVVYDGDIEAYLALTEGSTVDSVHTAVATELAAFKRPRRTHVLDRLPRTATGKLVRNPAALREAADPATT